MENTQTQNVNVTAAKSHSSPLRVLNFRRLWIGETISLVGDQFYLIALPWLVLHLTGNALAVGTVLAAAGIPRALFMLVGGALTDRFSSRNVMLASNLARLALTGLMAGLVLAGLIQFWMIYGFALLFGLADAFFFPAQTSIVPQLVDKDQLQAGNALIQGTAQFSLSLGPVLAGTLITILDGNSTHASIGIAVAFAIDAFSFLASVTMLWLIRIEKTNSLPADAESILSSIRVGLATVGNDRTLRILFSLIAAINLLVAGPLAVGVPVLARVRFTEGAAAFGLIMSAFGAGSLLGIILAGVLPRPGARGLGSILLSIMSLTGIGLALVGVAHTSAQAAVSTLIMGVAIGYNNILLVTWLQGRIPQAMLGRMMSLLMFAAIGLNPVSTALAGVLIGRNPTVLLVCSGNLMTVMTLLAAANPAIRNIGMNGR